MFSPHLKRLILAACLGVGLAGGVAGFTGVAGGHMASGPATPYTVAEVQAGLARQREAWIGRTILVRADVAGLAWSRHAGGWIEMLDLADARGAGVPALRVGLGPENPLLAALRRAPLLKGIVPAPQDMQPPGGVYRIQILGKAYCPGAPCHDAQLAAVRAVLLDASPAHSPL